MNPVSVVLRQLASGDYVLAAVLILFLVSGAYFVSQYAGLLRPGGAKEWLARAAAQIAAILGLEQAYELARGFIPHETGLAFLNAYQLVDLEWTHGLFIESRLQETFRPFHHLMGAINLFYIVCHVGVTIGALVWIYLWRREHYPFIRNMLMVTTGIALVVFYLYPTAPPRMFYNLGFVDPTQVYHFVAGGGAQPSSFTYNPYAAMPSLHVGYALVAGWSLFRAATQRWLRFLAVVYPFAMAAAVLISGEHWVLDVVGAFVTVLVARGVVAFLSHVLPLSVSRQTVPRPARRIT